MTCTISEEQLFSWVDRQAPDLVEHLATCPICRLKTQELRDSIGLVTQAVHAPAPRMPDRIGNYEVIRLLGSGGQGWVFEAIQPSPRRSVAVKVVRGGCMIDERDARRIRREADVLGLLKHPGIAGIYEAGYTTDGQPYFAMELVHGEPLLEYARTRHLPLASRLELFLRVCEALDHAHQQGVIHRDLKPSNILVEGTEQPKILDFGLARLMHPGPDATATVVEQGKIVGTLQYMSPEHARGDASAIDVASDIYSLTVILYELLVERPPYALDVRMPHHALRVVCEQAPERPGKFDRRLRGDLETILLKGLEKEPARRYQTVTELAEDIQRFLERKPVSARRPSAAYRFRKLIARNKAGAALVAIIFSMATALGAWMTNLYTESWMVRQRAEVPTTPLDIALLQSQAAELNWSTGQFAEAEKLCLRALKNFHEQVPDTNRAVLGTKVLLGRILTRNGRDAEAEPMLRKALQGYGVHYPKERVLAAEAKIALGECLTRRRLFGQAEIAMRDSYSIIRLARGSDDRRTQEARQALIELYVAWGKPDKVREFGGIIKQTPAPAIAPMSIVGPKPDRAGP